jgi:hypothetical protein
MATDTRPATVTVVPDASQAPRWSSSWWAIGGFAVVLLLVLGWEMLADPTLTAPTRDPAWYTWRADVILEDDPASIVGEWGPEGLFSGGYRVTVPLAGALLQRVAGVDSYTFSAFLMIGIPVLTGLALGAGAFRSRHDGLVVLLTMLASAAVFLTTPYVGYLDNIAILFLLSIVLAFAAATRDSWGARVAVFLVGIAAAFTHPTTCVLFGASLMGMFGWHLLTGRFRFGHALRSDAPLLWSTGLGMIVGLSMWLAGIWGRTASLQDAALPPPYNTDFFLRRLGEWISSLHPEIVVPLMLLALVGTVLHARRTGRAADQYEMAALWWMLPFVGVLSFLVVEDLPYYRFMNASAAPIALVGLGSYAAIRWLLSGRGAAKAAGSLAALLVVAAVGWLLVDGLQNRWAGQDNQWANQEVRISLAAVREVVEDAGDRPNVLVVNYKDTVDPETKTNTAYGWAKTYSNVFRTGLPGEAAKRSVTYLGTVENFRRPARTDGASADYDDAARIHWNELLLRREQYPADPVVFVIGQYYGGLCNGIADAEGCTPDVEAARFEEALAGATEIGQDVWVLNGDRFFSPDAATVERAQTAAASARARLDDHPGPLGDPLHLLRVLAALAALVVVPGLLVAPFFELRDTPSRIALVPAMSIVMTLLAGIAVLAVWRGPLTGAKAWIAVALACALGLALRFAGDRIVRPFVSVAGFFDRMFAVFSNVDFATLMGVQYVVQAGQGIVQGAIAKSIAFGGQEGFDVQNVPSADYLLEVILYLYVPYTVVSPFIGVFIDRFERRRVVWWTNMVSSAVIAVVAVTVLLPLGSGTTEGKPFETAVLVIGLLAAQAVVRVILAVKSAAIPDVLWGKDLLQGNGLSQAGGALAQIVGIAFSVAAGLALPAWLVVLAGAAVLVVGAIVAKRLHHVETQPHETTFGQEARGVVRNIVAGLREVAGRAPAAVGLSSFQMLRYQFWGFGLFVFALYAKNLVEGGAESQVPTAISGGVGLVGGVLGLILAQKWKDKVPPIRLLLASMALLGAGTLVFGGMVSILGFAGMLFVGFFAFFVGKISADTIVQQAMPDDFRGRAFALFDIAYNLGFIVPALILSFVWVEGDPTRTRTILMASGVVFLVLTAAIGVWVRRIRDRFAPQDDLVDGVPAR